MTIFEKLSIAYLVEKAKILVVGQPVLDGVLIDLNYITRGKFVIPILCITIFFLF